MRLSVLGATPWARRATAELRATGHVPAAASTNGSAEALTPQEHEIARLAASGLTNKQIGERLYLSHRTVSGHLYRIFPKLGISTQLRSAMRCRTEQRDQNDGEPASWACRVESCSSVDRSTLRISLSKGFSSG